MSEMIYVKKLITPEIASEMLLRNQNNRNIKKDTLKKIVNDIKTGKWEMTHQAIAFDTDGNLIDGQNRLTAVVMAGIPVEMMVSYNAPKSEKIDIGVRRSDTDSLYMAGIIEKNSIEKVNLTYPLVSYIINKSFYARKSRECTATQKHNVYLHLKDYIDPIIEIARAKKYRACGKTRSATILYAMLCAFHNGVPCEIIKEWHYIASTGDYLFKEDIAKSEAGKCVTYFATCVNTTAIDVNTDTIILAKAMSSIRHYANRTVIKRLYGEMVYPFVTVTEKELNYAPDLDHMCNEEERRIANG